MTDHFWKNLESSFCFLTFFLSKIKVTVEIMLPRFMDFDNHYKSHYIPEKYVF